MPPVNKTKEKTPQEIEREKQQELALGRQVKILEKRLEALKPSNFNPDSLRTQEDSLYSSLDFKLKLVRDKDGFFPPEFRKGKADELDFEIRKSSQGSEVDYSQRSLFGGFLPRHGPHQSSTGNRISRLNARAPEAGRYLHPY